MKKLAIVIALFAISAPSTLHAGEGALGQMCWTYGIADNRVYYAENYVEGDRFESFEALMEYTGVRRTPTVCILEEVGVFEDRRSSLFDEWTMRGLEPVNTTFLSDLDY
jgi:hypothetical protein